MEEVAYVPIPGALGFSLGETVVNTLIERGDLPADFYFRALSLPNETRADIVAQDVLAAAGLGTASNEAEAYLHSPLPDCVMVVGKVSLFRVLQSTPEDFHRLHDLRLVAEQTGVKDEYAWLLWEEMIRRLSPELKQRLQEFRSPKHAGERYTFGRKAQIGFVVARTVIKDAAVMKLYEEKPAGQGPMRRRLLRALLSDNHPEFFD